MQISNQRVKTCWNRLVQDCDEFDRRPTQLLQTIVYRAIPIDAHYSELLETSQSVYEKVVGLA